MTIEAYRYQLSPAEIANKAHRDAVGGLWEEIGRLQFDYLVAQGLRPEHRLLDVGCGALRGGVHFVRYLCPGNYFGMDANESLISAGRKELTEAGLGDKACTLCVDETFDFSRLEVQFDFALALSLFTHLPLNDIERCLFEMAGALRPGAPFFATFFESTVPHHVAPIVHRPGGITSHMNRDPYHYHFSAFEFMVRGLPLAVERIGDWGHPRGQRMLRFSRV